MSLTIRSILIIRGRQHTGIRYCTDTAISGIYGVTFNIAFNTIKLVLLATPLVFKKNTSLNRRADAQPIAGEGPGKAVLFSRALFLR
jgi:hypothetical protein